MVSQAPEILQQVSSHLEFLGYKMTEIQDECLLAQDGKGSNFVIQQQANGVLFRASIATRKLDEADFGGLFVCMNSFNDGSLLTKAYVPYTEVSSVTFECWYPPPYNKQAFAHFFDIYREEMQVCFDEELREKIAAFFLEQDEDE